ncbi:hydrogenase formation protein HypD [Candidatus Sumerlaeota bacterium]|nr:hydrogenase formation protein HypD [Candidatus Sumerlaeota bacterium]
MTPAATEKFAERMRAAIARIGKPVRLMEVCGTHTHAIARHGLRALFPPELQLVSGPGCPVCVTPQSEIERMILLAREPGTILCTFGDMLRVPGIRSSLEQERTNGADIRVVYSPLDALAVARKEPEREVVFLAVGFETTAPVVASVALEALESGTKNFSLLVGHKLIPPAMDALLRGECQLDGFLTPGHVSVVIGSQAYDDLAREFRVPCVATGFEPADILEGVAMLLESIAECRSGSFIQYRSAVRPEGNPQAREVMFRAFRKAGSEWRGLGSIPGSGLKLKRDLASLDAAQRFSLPEVAPVEIPGCRCGDVLRGLLSPADCPLFGNACTPRTPVGPCMVSSEGSCAARYKYE